MEVNDTGLCSFDGRAKSSFQGLCGLCASFAAGGPLLDYSRELGRLLNNNLTSTGLNIL